MIDVPGLRAWLNTLNDNDWVAVDDGGLTLVRIRNGDEVDSDVYIEVGGEPPEDTNAEHERVRAEIKERE